MKRTFPLLGIIALFASVIMVGCAGEDYSDLDNEYATMDESLRSRYDSAMESYNAWNSDFTTVTVADDWDATHTASYETAKARMSEYDTKFQEGKTQMDQWKADLDAAKAESREAYEQRLAEARDWYNSYNAWLDTYYTDWNRYNELHAAGTTDPWWYTMYSVDVNNSTVDMDDTTSAMNGDDGGVTQAAKDVANGAKDVGEKVGQGAADVANGAKDVGEKVGEGIKEGFRKITNDSDDD